jgi:NAD(P)H-nitrite reductase large subunit
VTEALWGGVLEQVVVSRLDRNGRPVPGSREKFNVDTLCLSFGFVPNTELAQLAGCRLDFEPDRGGWAPRLTGHLETSVSNLFVAGEAAGIEGAGAALVTGRLAGLAAAERLGRLTGAELDREMAGLGGQRRRQRRFGAMLNRLFRPLPGLAGLVAGQTPVCRCQEVSAAEVRAAMAAGADTLDALKIWTRAGQGHCQGRVCGPVLAWLMAGQAGCSERQAGLFQVRPPLKPAPLGVLAGGESK